MDKPNSTFPKEERLLKSKEFRQTLDDGCKVIYPEFVLFYTPGKVSSRLGLIASKKVGNAVIRNKAKRQVREVFRQLAVDPPLDIVAIIRRNISQKDFQDIEKSFVRGLEVYKKKCEKKRKSAI